MPSAFDETRYSPMLVATAKRIARTGRIVVQPLLSSELLAEVEWRLFLIAMGELLAPSDGSERAIEHIH